ncbi:hypothetical protein BG004_003018 [Podila humilis]|nr:hypothetical protein BG004_003018 [Podila humilis]
MPAETKRKFQTGQPVSTRRRAKKAKLAAAIAERSSVTPSKKAQRKAARPPKPIKENKVDSEEDQDEDDEDENEDKDEDEDGDDGREDQDDEGQQYEDDEQGSNDDQSIHTPRSTAAEDSEDGKDQDDVSDEEAIGKGKKGYKKKIKKPSGKKGKVFADTNAMLSIIDLVAGKEEARAQVKQAQMGKIKSKLGAKEQKQAEKEKARKALIDKKIEEIKHKKTEKRKESKQRAVLEKAKAQASAGKRSVSFQV